MTNQAPGWLTIAADRSLMALVIQPADLPLRKCVSTVLEVSIPVIQAAALDWAADLLPVTDASAKLRLQTLAAEMREAGDRLALSAGVPADQIS